VEGTENDKKDAAEPGRDENRVPGQAKSDASEPDIQPAEAAFDVPGQPAETAPVRAVTLADHLAEVPAGSRYDSMLHLLNLWNPDASISPDMEDVADDAAFLTLAARQNGLSILRIDGNLSLIRKLNIPAILTFNGTDALEAAHMAVVRTDGRTMTLSDGAGTDIIAPDSDIAACWTGTAYVFWKDFLNLQGTVGLNAPEDAVIALKMHLREIGSPGIVLNTDFDPRTRTAVKQLQAARGIHVDGYVGPMTKIILYNEKASLDIPHLTDPQPVPPDRTDHLPSGEKIAMQTSE